jgi:hypothetical protein
MYKWTVRHCQVSLLVLLRTDDSLVSIVKKGNSTTVGVRWAPKYSSLSTVLLINNQSRKWQFKWRDFVHATTTTTTTTTTAAPAATTSITTYIYPIPPLVLIMISRVSAICSVGWCSGRRHSGPKGEPPLPYTHTYKSTTWPTCWRHWCLPVDAATNDLVTQKQWRPRLTCIREVFASFWSRPGYRPYWLIFLVVYLIKQMHEQFLEIDHKCFLKHLLQFSIH